MKVDILHEDADIIVCLKPYGMPTQDDKTNDLDLVNYLKTYISESNDMDTEPYLAVVHRLDRPVAGIMVFAKNKAAAANLSEQIREGRAVKFYQAVLTGELPEEEGSLINYLKKDGQKNHSAVVGQNDPDGKKAELHYEVLDVIETETEVLSYVLIELITGRHHQIRVQMSKEGAGIWGDTKYNKVFMNTKKQYKEIGLFATRLEFDHPVSGEHMVFKEEPYGQAFDQLDVLD